MGVLGPLGFCKRHSLAHLFLFCVTSGGTWERFRAQPAQQPQGGRAAGCRDLDTEDHCVPLGHHPHGHPAPDQSRGLAARAELSHFPGHWVGPPSPIPVLLGTKWELPGGGTHTSRTAELRGTVMVGLVTSLSLPQFPQFVQTIWSRKSSWWVLWLDWLSPVGWHGHGGRGCS